MKYLLNFLLLFGTTTAFTQDFYFHTLSIMSKTQVTKVLGFCEKDYIYLEYTEKVSSQQGELLATMSSLDSDQGARFINDIMTETYFQGLQEFCHFTFAKSEPSGARSSNGCVYCPSVSQDSSRKSSPVYNY